MLSASGNPLWLANGPPHQELQDRDEGKWKIEAGDADPEGTGNHYWNRSFDNFNLHWRRSARLGWKCLFFRNNPGNGNWIKLSRNDNWIKLSRNSRWKSFCIEPLLDKVQATHQLLSQGSMIPPNIISLISNITIRRYIYLDRVHKM